MRNVKRMYRKNKLNFRRKFEGKEERRIICNNCRKPEHIMADCPEFKKKMTSSFKPKRPDEKKAYKATWDSKSESEDEVDTANMCFMTNTPKVTPQPLDDEDELSKEVLVHAFVELLETYDNKKIECSKLKKEVAQRDEISSNLVCTQKEFNAYKVACKAKFPKIDEK